jgi:hypothetical protein
MEVTGRIKMIDQTKEVGTSGFKKRDIVVTTDEQYPQHILVQFVQDKCDLLNNFQVGEQVKIDINLRGREWTNPQGETVYFNTIQGWRIGKLQAEAPVMPNTPSPAIPSPETFAPVSNLNENEPDDLPF